MLNNNRDQKNKYIREYLKRRYEERRSLAIELLGGRCVQCGSTNELQFDHIDHGHKLFDIADRLAQYSWARLIPEILKCQLLCFDCHVDKSAIEQHGRRAQHGTITMYTHYKCRCPACVEAHRAYQAQHSRRSKTDQPPGEFARLND